MPSARAVTPGWCTPLADLREPLRPSSPLMSTTALALCLPAEIEAAVCGGRVNMPSGGYLKTVPLGNASADNLSLKEETLLLNRRQEMRLSADCGGRGGGAYRP